MMMLVIALLFVASVWTKPVDNDVNLEAVDNGYLFEGDMIMSKAKISAAINGDDVDKVDNNFGYGLSTSSYSKWTNGIVPYVMHDNILGIKSITGPTERAIKKAMDAWEAKTCIRFVPRTNEKDYIEFFDDGFGKCYSHVGKTGGKQIISLGFGCFTTGIAIHEIGHALGMYHEQSRPDRDDYVEIIYENIQKGKENNFRKYGHSSIDSLGSPYDYDSIMHYEWNAFAKFPLFMATIKAKVGNPKFGQRSYISVEDAIQINKYYGCKQNTYK